MQKASYRRAACALLTLTLVATGCGCRTVVTEHRHADGSVEYTHQRQLDGNLVCGLIGLVVDKRKAKAERRKERRERQRRQKRLRRLRRR